MAGVTLVLMTLGIILLPALILLYLTRRMKRKISEEIERLDREIRKMREEQKDLNME